MGAVIGTQNEREIKRLSERTEQINVLEPEMQKLSEEDFPAYTEKFKARLAEGETLDDLLPEAFALCREAGRRTLNMRHFDVQFMGGMALHEGKIAEMKTGEGKTLVATLPVYLNSLEGRGVHVITVNDYLAKRDASWMSPIYRLLGLSVGVIVHDLDDAERRLAYQCDVTYGTNNEFGFDYLRDNMKFELGDRVQREHRYAIVDEVDSILIDEARTPLIISGASEESTEKYYRIDKVIPHLKEGEDYEIDEKRRTASLLEGGIEKAEKILGLENLYDPANVAYTHHVYQALRAHTLYKRDKDYVVKDGEVIIVDEFTGRLMPGRRWSDGLHQAVEAKEQVKIERENQTLATITFQNYFRMYDKLAGMTGTAETEAAEFEKIYELEVIVAPTNRLLIRHEYPDVVYRTEREKFNAVIEEIKEYHLRGQPVLVGTIAIEKSERLSAQLRKTGLLPNRLQELLKAAGLEGPKLLRWAQQLAAQHGAAFEWLIPAGANVSAAKKLLAQRAYADAGRNGSSKAFLQALLKKGHSDYFGHQPEATDGGGVSMARALGELVKSADEKMLPIFDYLADVRCTPQRFVEVLEEKDLRHNILNAKQHEKEALIVAQAGRVGAVTVSTNMAGRGTDILLGGNPEFMAREEFRKNPEKYREQGIDPEPPERPATGSAPEVYNAFVDAYSKWRENWAGFIARFKATTDIEHDRVIGLGGLHILGTERHESRRIDNQLRGRAGRQGDPGSSRFFLSLEDDLLRIFAGERISNIMHKLGMEEGVPIESRLISKRIEAAQKAVEAQNFESRKHLLEYDDVMNKQRETIYGLRDELLKGADQKERVQEAIDRVIDWLVETFCPKDQHPDEWNVKGLHAEFWGRFGVDLRQQQLTLDPKRLEVLRDELREIVNKRYEEREQVWTPERMRIHERMILLQVVDAQWKDNLLAMDHLKEGIGLRGYGQRDPLVEYKRESYDMFAALMDRIEDETLRYLFLMRTPDEEEAAIREYQRRKRREQQEMRMVGSGASEKPQQVIRREKVGRNDPCPCGSGKKYKKCHGAGAVAAAEPAANNGSARPSDAA
ncbi:MAG TPA: preprotein translocase subunit SecA [Terriglobia bacterium]|nr:preprotein translocase subunit SecA [Terriglobia bacterium]